MLWDKLNDNEYDNCWFLKQPVIIHVLIMLAKKSCLWEHYTDVQQDAIISGYRKISNISRTKSQNLNKSRLVLQLSLPNPLQPGVESRMKM